MSSAHHPAAEWQQLEAGLRQRVRALNMFLHDVYHARTSSARARCRPTRCSELAVPARDARCRCRQRIYSHIAGIDIVRAGAGEYYVLEDNLRVPSGVLHAGKRR